jgi:sporulation protein YlmC with PRC-barrel domain
MLVSAKELFDYTIRAQDGDMGSVDDVLFDDTTYAVRYVVVSTGIWLFGRKVLVAPASIRPPGEKEKALPVDLTKEQIKDSPDMAVDLPLSRDQEVQYHDYFHWPYYWGGAEQTSIAYGVPVAPAAMVLGDTNVEPDPQIPPDKRDQRLRSAKEVIGYGLETGSERVGKVTDLGVDLAENRVNLFVIELDAADDHRRVAAPSEDFEIGWPEEAVSTSVDMATLMAAPRVLDTPLSEQMLEGAVRRFQQRSV